MKVYLAGDLFNAGTRLHNLMLEKHLKALGHDVELPQRRALNFFSNGVFNILQLVADCLQQCSSSKKVFVGCVDGADADSGTSMEYGVAIATTGRAITYRTDFRTAIEQEVGLNAMLQARGTIFIYFPCFVTELDEVDAYYHELAQKIHEALLSLEEE